MPITEYHSISEEKELGFGTTFVVNEEMIVFDRKLAHAVNHIFNHLRFLITYIDVGMHSNDEYLDFLIENHPLLREKATALKNGFNYPDWDMEKWTPIRRQIVEQVKNELLTMIEMTTAMAWDIDIISYERNRKKRKEKQEIIENYADRLAEIPFIDYHAIVEEKPSVVKFIEDN
jgi:hypothetical protein